jgi:hypothetical protein
MKDQPAQYKLPLQPTLSHETGSGLDGRKGNLFGPLPGKQTLLGDFFPNLGIGDKLAVEEEWVVG